MLQAREVTNQEQQKLVPIIAGQANNAPFAIGARGFMQNLIAKTEWPENFKQQRIGALTGIADFDARALIGYAVNQGTNPKDRRYTVLGELLRVLLEDLGFEDRYAVVALISSHNLYLHEATLQALERRYQVPVTSGAEEPAVEFGPDIDWEEPEGEVELQFWNRPGPDMQDVGFLKRAIERAASVCRVEVEAIRSQGTGVLIGPNLVLTNYHVLHTRPGDDIEANARLAVLRFGSITAADGKEADGQTFKLSQARPILSSSPINQLDYILLQVEDGISQAEDISEAPYSLALPYRDMPIHILQHPEGEALKLAVSDNGVDKVIEARGLVQYVTLARSGSSGAPCFNENWEMVALHHAQRSRSIGSIREGIIFKAIHDEIREHLG